VLSSEQAKSFQRAPEEYERGRPGWPPEVLDLVPVGDAATVLDLGAGTGKLTRVLAARYRRVLALEPLDELRAVLERQVPQAETLEGVAEAIPLADASVAAVTVADAFHWFDQARAVVEIARVLRPGGGLAVISTIPDWTGASWAHELGELVMQNRPEHPFFDGPPWQDAVAAAGGWTAPREVRVTTVQPARPDKIVDHLASMSWIAALPDDERAATLQRMRALVESGETPDELPIHVVIGLAELG
jgi:SAM-dependent methyltransferase